MSKKEQVLKKAEQGQELTVDEIKIYQEVVKSEKHVYGKYGTLKKKYLEDKSIDWTIADLPTYLHGIDVQAEDMYNTLYAKLSVSTQYKRTGEFMEDYRRKTDLQHAIEEEILNEIVYTEEVI